MIEREREREREIEREREREREKKREGERVIERNSEITALNHRCQVLRYIQRQASFL